MQEEKQSSPFLNEEQKMQLRQNRTYTERFDMLMKLIRISHMLQGAKLSPPEAIRRNLEAASRWESKKAWSL